MACPLPRLLCSNLLFNHQRSPWRCNNTLLPPNLSLRQCHLARDLYELLSGSLGSPSESVNKASECHFLQRRPLVLPLQSHASGLWLLHSRLYSRHGPMPYLNSTTLNLNGRRRKCRCVSGRRGNNEKENERGRGKWRASRSGRRCGLSKNRKSHLHRTITSSLGIDSKEALVASRSRDHHRKSQVDLRRMLLRLCSSNRPSSSLLRSR